jgi:hypothetical protein
MENLPSTQQGVSLGSNTMLNVLSNEQIETRDKIAKALEAAVKDQSPASALCSHIESCYTDAEKAKRETGITDRLLDAQRRRKGEYDATKMAEIMEMGGSKVYSKDTEIKCNAAEAIISDVLMPYGDKIWSIMPTPIPDMPADIENMIVQATMMKVAEEIMQTGATPSDKEVYEWSKSLRKEIEEEIKDEAAWRAENMRREMADQLTEMRWNKTFNDCVSNLVTFGTGFVKGPIVCHRRKMAWKEGEYVVVNGFGLKTTAPSPLHCFPSPASIDPDDGYFIERMWVTGKELSQFRGVPYYQDREIKDLMESHPRGYTVSMPDDQTKAGLDEQYDPTQNLSGLYELKEFWGSIRGDMLREWGMSGLEDLEYYDVQVITCANRVLKVMPNPDPIGRIPYYKSCYKPVTGSFWGNGVPHLMSDSQDIANACIRSICNNMAMASGPMMAVDADKLPPGYKIESLHPWQILQFSNPSGLASKLIEFFQPDSNVGELLRVYDRMIQRMDDESGIPAYSYGNEKVAGAGRTSSGLSMLMNASARGIKKAMAEIDVNIIDSFIQRLYVWNMRYNPNESIKGDAQVITHGTTKMLLQDMKLARLSEFTQKTNNQVDMQIIGLEGRADMLDKEAKMMDLDIERYIPDGEELRNREARMLAQQLAMQQGGRNTEGTPTSLEKAVA